MPLTRQARASIPPGHSITSWHAASNAARDSATKKEFTDFLARLTRILMESKNWG